MAKESVADLKRYYFFQAMLGYEFIKSREKVTRIEYQEHFGYNSDKKAERHLKKMVDFQLISRRGRGPSTYYEIIPT